MKEFVEQMNVQDIQDIENEYPAFSFFYRSDGLRVKGFIIFPKNIDQKKKYPVIFVNRGGTGEFGKITERAIKNYSFFAKNNYITIMSQYRGSDGGGGVDQMGGDDVNDVINLYEHVKCISFADMSRIGIWGVSRGGLMVFRILALVSWIKACVVISPIVDEVHMAQWRLGWRQHQIDTYGGLLEEQIKRSPLYWPEKIPHIPILMFVGMKDDRIDPNKAIEMAHKINAELVTCENEGHQIAHKTVEATMRFFKKVL